MSELADLTPIERETSQIFDRTINRGPTSSVGRNLYSDLRTAASKSPSLVGKLRAGLGRLISPATGEELSGALFRQIAEIVVDGDAGPLGEAVHAISTCTPFARRWRSITRQLGSSLLPTSSTASTI